MFIFSFAYMLKKKYNREIIIDDSIYDKRPGLRMNGLDNVFFLYHYRSFNNRRFLYYDPQTKIGVILLRIIHTIKKKILIDQIIRQGDSIKYVDFSITGNKVWFEGFWQNPRYFDEYRDGIVNQLQLKSISDKVKDLSRYFKDNKFCAIHVRRGDYASFYNNAIIPVEYYFEAIKILKENNSVSKFLIFSDDLPNCKEQFKGESYFFIDDFGTFTIEEELHLMSNCDSFIIANSSFSWWGAYLSMSHNVICPRYKRWNDDFYHPDWTQIDVDSMVQNKV